VASRRLVSQVAQSEWSTTTHLGPLLVGLADAVRHLAFSRDGTLILSIGGDGTIRRWDLDMASLERRACRMANRNLTREEWRQYLGSEPYRKTCPVLP
jgi:hypothetical protein